MKALFALPALALASQLAALDLRQAEQLAIGADPELDRLHAEARALGHEAVFNVQLPDPQLNLSTGNLPVPSFSLSDEPMAQVQVGIAQRFPARAERRARAGVSESRADRVLDQAILRELQLRRQVRRLWVSLHHEHALLDIDFQRQRLLGELTDALASAVEADRDSQRALLFRKSRVPRVARATVARRVEIRTLRAELAELLPAAHLPSAWSRPELAVPESFDLDQHPELQVANAGVSEAEAGIELARAAFKPGWGVDVGVARRIDNVPVGAPDDTLINARLSIDLPLFTKNRQSRQLSAAHEQYRAANTQPVARRRDLGAMLESARSRYSEFSELVGIYVDQVLPPARAAAEAASDQYRNGRIGLEQALEARLEVLEIERELAESQRTRDLAAVELAYLGGQ